MYVIDYILCLAGEHGANKGEAFAIDRFRYIAWVLWRFATRFYEEWCAAEE